MIRFKASLLAADYGWLAKQAVEVEKAGIDGIQIDIMDGRYVPDITFGPGIVRAIRQAVYVHLEVDLMIVEPEKHIQAFADAGADRIILHLESCTHLHRHLDLVHEIGKKNGVAVAPGTPVSSLVSVLDVVDFIQIMTVNPGWGGQTLIPSQIEKIRKLRSILDDAGLSIPIGVDGGVYPDTVPLIVTAGAEELVSGTGLFNNEKTVRENLRLLRKSVPEK